MVHGTVLGVLHAGTLQDRVFTADDAALLQLAADRAAVAVQSLRARDDQAAALALQRSLVRQALPTLAAVEVAARYVPGSGHVGGDWYDVFVLPSGKLGLVVGDVRGYRACRRGHRGPHPQRPARVRAGVPRPG